jgi:hypothetical protein
MLCTQCQGGNIIIIVRFALIAFFQQICNYDVKLCLERRFMGAIRGFTRR